MAEVVDLPRLLRCPRCDCALTPSLRCARCGAEPARLGGVLDFLREAERDAPSQAVTAFYEERPFPGYAEGDDASALLDRSRRSSFLRALDGSIGASATVLDCGCGTGQLAAFLALAAPRRQVVGADACRASLAEADRFRDRAAVRNLRLLRGDLFSLPVARGAFDVVVCRGVVHHTPRWRDAVASVGACVAPEGLLVLGFYESAARLAHRARRGLFRAIGRPVRFLDPILSRGDLSDEKKETWIADQYRHPLERILPLPAVVATLQRGGFEWVRSVPPAVSDGELFASTPEPGALGRTRLRAAWALAGLRDEDAGLVCVVARRSQPRS